MYSLFHIGVNVLLGKRPARELGRRGQVDLHAPKRACHGFQQALGSRALIPSGHLLDFDAVAVQFTLDALVNKARCQKMKMKKNLKRGWASASTTYKGTKEATLENLGTRRRLRR
jgi:hypothetical protein